VRPGKVAGPHNEQPGPHGVQCAARGGRVALPGRTIVALSDGEHAKALMFVSRANGAATGGPSRTLWPADRAVPVAARAVLKRGPC